MGEGISPHTYYWSTSIPVYGSFLRTDAGRRRRVRLGVRVDARLRAAAAPGYLSLAMTIEYTGTAESTRRTMAAQLETDSDLRLNLPLSVALAVHCH